MKPKKLTSSFSTLLIILGIIVGGSFAFIGGFGSFSQNSDPGTSYNIKESAIPPAEKSLQIKTLTVTSPVPVPTSSIRCPIDGGRPADEQCICSGVGLMKIECKDRKCVRVISPKIWNCENARVITTEYCESKVFTPTDGIYCLAKPVIYLYPKTKTSVSVSVETSGEIIVSDPLYPIGGWKNITAFPDGNLIYEGKKYRELFYESSVSSINPPKDGIVIEAKNIEQTLENMNKKLGLSEFESRELTDFWVSRLQNASPYLLVSLIQGKEKDRLDKLNINPKPDTLIEVLYYFRPLEKHIEVKALNLPETPLRKGFTAVEWGGTIDSK